MGIYMHMYFIRVLLKHILVLVVLDAVGSKHCGPVFIRYEIGSLSSTWYCTYIHGCLGQT